MKPIRTQFWSETVYALKASTIPARLRKDKTEATKWSVRGVLGEILRDPAYCRHVESPRPVEHVWGLHPCDLRNLEKALHDGAAMVTETYQRRGRVHTRRQKATTPVLLVAVASWPGTEMHPTPERDRWVELVVQAARFRWGECLRGVYAHPADEGHYHLHLVVADDARPAKRLHLGHAYAAEVASRGHARVHQAEAYRLGCVAAQDWIHREVSAAMGFARKSLAPRPRLPRAAAMRLRQAELEAAEEAQAAQDAALAKAAQKIQEACESLERAHAALASREARLGAAEAVLRAHWSRVKDQRALEARLAYVEPDVF